MIIINKEVYKRKLFFTKALKMSNSFAFCSVWPVMCRTQIILFLVIFEHWSYGDTVDLLRKHLIEWFHFDWQIQEKVKSSREHNWLQNNSKALSHSTFVVWNAIVLPNDVAWFRCPFHHWFFLKVSVLLIWLFHIEEVPLGKQVLPCQAIPKSGPESDECVNRLTYSSIILFKAFVYFFIYFLQVFPLCLPTSADNFTPLNQKFDYCLIFVSKLNYSDSYVFVICIVFLQVFQNLFL